MGIFTGNVKIRSFNELEYFKNAIVGGSTVTADSFEGCSSLEEIVAPSITFRGTNLFKGTRLKKFRGKMGANFKISYTNSESIDADDCTVASTSLKNVFLSNSYAKKISLKNWNTSNVTDMNGMFYQCESLEDLDVTGLDTSKSTTFMQMFLGCSSLKNIDVSNFDTSSCENFRSMFSACYSLETLDVTNFDTSKATNIFGMFSGCNSLTEIDLSNFDTSNVVNMNAMFSTNGTSHFTALDLRSFDTSKVTDWVNMLYLRYNSLTSLKVSSNFFNCMARDNNPIRSLNISNLAHWTNADEIEEFLNLLPDVSSKATADAPYSIVMHSATKTVMNDNSLVSIATNKGWTIG